MSTTPQSPSRVGALRWLRRIGLITAGASLSVAAGVVGIRLLFFDELGSTQFMVLAVSLLFAAFSLCGLANLAIAGRPQRTVGYVGIIVNTVALLLSLLLLGGELDFYDVGRWIIISFVVAGGFAKVSLLLLLAGRRNRWLRRGLRITISLTAGCAFSLCIPGFVGPRVAESFLGMAAVLINLDILATFALVVAALAIKDGPGAGGDPSASLEPS